MSSRKSLTLASNKSKEDPPMAYLEEKFTFEEGVLEQYSRYNALLFEAFVRRVVK